MNLSVCMYKIIQYTFSHFLQDWLKLIYVHLKEVQLAITVRSGKKTH